MLIMEAHMVIAGTETDMAVLAEIGRRIAQVRISMSLRQADVAARAGIGARTMERLETGDSVQMVTLIRVMRELGLLTNMNAIAPDTGPRPLDYIARRGRQRVRAPRISKVEEPRAPWKWGDDK
jgi:transcriptional regulator with XRE-family HTH domain